MGRLQHVAKFDEAVSGALTLDDNPRCPWWAGARTSALRKSQTVSYRLDRYFREKTELCNPTIVSFAAEFLDGRELTGPHRHMLLQGQSLV